jgi:hypothetical protein
MTKPNPLGYSGTPLSKKLGIKPHHRVLLIGSPDQYRSWLTPLPEGVAFREKVSGQIDLVHLFATEKKDLMTELKVFKRELPASTPVWISWPKKASKVATTITEDVIREVALPLGYVDVKVCAVNEIWSGLKLVVRKELR